MDGGDGTGEGCVGPDGGTGAGDGRAEGGEGTGEGWAVPGGTGAGVRPDGAAAAWAAASVSRVEAGWLAADATARPEPPATRAATGRPIQVIVRLRVWIMLDNLRFGQP